MSVQSQRLTRRSRSGGLGLAGHCEEHSSHLTTAFGTKVAQRQTKTVKSAGCDRKKQETRVRASRVVVFDPWLCDLEEPWVRKRARSYCSRVYKHGE